MPVVKLPYDFVKKESMFAGKPKLPQSFAKNDDVQQKAGWVLT